MRAMSFLMVSLDDSNVCRDLSLPIDCNYEKCNLEISEIKFSNINQPDFANISLDGTSNDNASEILEWAGMISIDSPRYWNSEYCY